MFNTLLSGLAPGVAPSAPTVANQVTPGTSSYRIACLRLLNAYLDVSFETVEDELDATDGDPLHKGSASTAHDTDDDDDDDEDVDEDDSSSEDYSDDEDDESEDIETDSDMGAGGDDDEEVPDVKESVSKILREFYPVALRNICRLLSSQNEAMLVYCWKCLEAFFKVSYYVFVSW